ncbi:MAG: cyclic nucleotide-binding domain-containing protein [Candidatus Wallbacteria bacterium]|nr:cyclic nucleotide-binding domain-containing protein [Candidatus Wallbacteria bacterium]
MDAQTDFLSSLKSCPLLRDLSAEELDRLQTGSRIREYDEQNPVICEEGKVGDGFFVILLGQVRVFKHDEKGREHLLAVLKAGDFFGEMALLDMEVRSATCHALEPVKVLWFGRESFEKLRMEGSPIIGKLLFRMMIDLSHRLRLLNERFVYLRSCYTGGRA